MNIIITAPSLDMNVNVSGISSVTNFIIDNNLTHNYTHFKLGRRDLYKPSCLIFPRILKAYTLWICLMIFRRNVFVHFNFALEKRSIIRDSPMILFARLVRKRIIIHLHGGEYLMKDRIPHWIHSLLKLILSGKEIKLTLSQMEKEAIIKKYSAQNVIVLSNCVDIKEARKFSRNYPSENPVKILFIGRIVERKGIDIILPTLKLLKEKGLDFSFVLAGAGPDLEKYVSKCRTFLGPTFDFRGVVSGPKKYELLRQCDIFLLPSLCGEGLPMSLLECMSFGMACVVTDDGSMKDIITSGENGIIVEKSSISSLAEAIENLICNKDLSNKIGRNAREYIFENHDPEAYISQLNNIYDQVLEKNKNKKNKNYYVHQ